MDDFAKIDLRVAKVLTCERVPKSDKLLKLTLDVGVGADPRTVVSGIAATYQPEQMVGRTVIYLANLKPAKIRGVLSQGMILAAGDADVLALSALDRDAPPGTSQVGRRDARPAFARAKQRSRNWDASRRRAVTPAAVISILP